MVTHVTRSLFPPLLPEGSGAQDYIYFEVQFIATGCRSDAYIYVQHVGCVLYVVYVHVEAFMLKINLN